MFITIVIPTYNRSRYLSQCLDALSPQVRGDGEIEVIAVDDGSAVGQAQENRRLCEAHGVAFFPLARNSGVAAARNAGLANARGVWVVFIDDDFRVAGGWAAALKRTLRSQKEEVVGVEGAVEPSGGGLWDREVQNPGGGQYLTCHMAYRKSVLDAAGGFDVNFKSDTPSSEDHELAARMLRWGAIVFAPGLRGVHLPRTVRLWKYAASSFRRVSHLLNADYYFFCKQADSYHRFRYYRTFWGTYLSLLARHVFSTLRRRRLSDFLSHPLQGLALLLASSCEQMGAWLCVPRFIAMRLSGRSSYFHTLIDTGRTARFWGLEDPADTTMLQFRFSNLRSLLFPVFKQPVYDKRPLMRRIAGASKIDKCIIMLRIDDVFPSYRESIGRFLSIMNRRRLPYLAAVRGDELLNPAYAPDVERLRASGAEIGIHGFSHEGSFGPFQSELLQMKFPDIKEKVRAISATALFKERPPIAFVPPYNAVAAEQIAWLSRLFPVVTGGPETMRFCDRWAGPVAMKGGGWFVPTSYPYYSTARSLLESGVIRQLSAIKGWITISLHLTEEAKNGFAALDRLLEALPSAPVQWRIFTNESSGAAYFTGDGKEA